MVRRRRRRVVLTAGASTLAAVVVVATLIGGMPHSDRSTDPVDDPTEGTGGRTVEDLSWAPHRIRAEGEPIDWLEARDGALEARFWAVCERPNRGSTCDPGTYDHRVVHFALEVTADGYRTSGLFGLHGGPGEIPEIQQQPFDDDSIYVQDWGREGGTRERYRLLNVDGTTTELTMFPSTAPAAAGPDIVRTSNVAPGLSRVDEAAGTIQRLDLPAAVYQWAESAADELLWGVANGCVVYWQRPGGDFAQRDLDCTSPDLSIDDSPRSAAWFTAERMAVTELGGSEEPPRGAARDPGPRCHLATDPGHRRTRWTRCSRGCVRPPSHRRSGASPLAVSATRTAGAASAARRSPSRASGRC